MLGIIQPKLSDKYTFICKIGQGSYGYVYLYEKKQQIYNTPISFFDKLFQKQQLQNDQYLAVKIYKKLNNNRDGIDFSCLRQITCLQSFKHQNVLECKQVFYQQKSNGPIPYQISVVMPFTLQIKFVLQKIPQIDKLNVVKQIIKGLEYIHQRYYMHRDLTISNIFVGKDGFVKIADFGFSKEFGTPYQKFTVNACTMEYRAPQVFMNTHYYTQKSDIWSLGCVIYQVITGKRLFKAQNVSPQINLLAQIFYLFGTPTQDNWQTYSLMPLRYNFKHQLPKCLSQKLHINKDLNYFLKYIMQLDPTKRPSIQQILNHQYIKNIKTIPLSINQLYQSKIESLKKK